MLSACLEETLIRNVNFIAGEKGFQDRNRSAVAWFVCGVRCGVALSVVSRMKCSTLFGLVLRVALGAGVKGFFV